MFILQVDVLSDEPNILEDSSSGIYAHEWIIHLC
jgi:hypothetical protein